VLWIRYKNAEGALSRESTGQSDVKVAEAILAKRRSEVAMLSHFPSRKFELVSFHELLKAWEPAHLTKKPSFSYLLPRVRDAFGGAKAREMTTEKVQEFLDRPKDEDGLSASSVNHYRTILNSIFNQAVRHGRYDANPVRAIHQFREPPGRDRFLSVEEFRLLLEKCKDPEARTGHPRWGTFPSGFPASGVPPSPRSAGRSTGWCLCRTTPGSERLQSDPWRPDDRPVAPTLFAHRQNQLRQFVL
jgi:hypothetical protein